MQTDVKAAYTESDAAVVTFRTRVKGLFIVVNAAGTDPVVLYDNASGAAGNVLLKAGANAVGSSTVLVPGQGIVAQNGIYVDTGSAAQVTVFYG